MANRVVSTAKKAVSAGRTVTRSSKGVVNVYPNGIPTSPRPRPATRTGGGSRPRGTGGTRTRSIPGSQGRAPTFGPSSPYYPNNPPPPGYGPPPKQPGFFAQHGKKTAAAVAGGALVGGAIKNRTGKAVDPTTGLPKGMYGY
jgi:hypothetical protein